MSSNICIYDDNNQLIRENNDRRQYTQTWEYDAFGNITSTSKYAYTTGELGEPTETIEYKYEDENGWGDLLTEYNGQTIEYDEIGNPRYVRDAEENVVKSYTWEQGRRLKTLATSSSTWTYSYDISGLRTQRTNGTTSYEYIYAGDKLVRMVKNGEVVDFGYAGGQLATMTYDGVTYYYVLNGQGDVLGLTDSTGKMVIGYVYSAYGIPTPLKADETLTPILKNLNPFMYRGYVYDIESGLYYLQSRYYDPEIGRFINADSYASTGQGVLGNNMFAYCQNNPVVYADPSGYMPEYQGDPEYGQAWDFGQWLYEKLKEAKEKHYSRNDNTPAFPEEFDPEYFEDWDDGVSANCHQFTSENKNNKKYVSPDGRYEAIYDENNHLVTDSRDVGTYNYASPDNLLGHFILDVYPWILWGNSPDDSTKPHERYFAFWGF